MSQIGIGTTERARGHGAWVFSKTAIDEMVADYTKTERTFSLDV